METTRKIRSALGSLFDVITLTTGVFLAVSSTTHFGSSLHWLRTASAVWVPIFAFYKTWAARAKKSDLRASKAKEDLILACQRVVSHIAESCECELVSVNHLTACIWFCHRADRFREAAVFYLLPHRSDHGVSFNKYKGVAGRTWRTGRPLEQDFNRAMPEHKWGLSDADLAKIKDHEYTGVWTAPLYKSKKLVAVFVLEYSGKQGFACIQEQVKGTAIRHIILGGCQETLKTAKLSKIKNDPV